MLHSDDIPLPSNPDDLTVEHARLICRGDVKGVLRDILRLPVPVPAAEPEAVRL